jgi:PAS domain-containing protein
VAQALTELSAQLRGRLTEAGADRTTLRALIDELPVGILLFDPRGVPYTLNGRARELCRFTPAEEQERARHLAQMPAQAEALKRVTTSRVTEELPLELPWAPGVALRARWLAIAAPNGEVQVALVVLPAGSLEAEAAQLRGVLGAATQALRQAARQLAKPEDAQRCLQVAEEAEANLLRVPPRPEDIEVLELGALCARALERVGSVPKLELPDPSVKVLEAGGRSAYAIAQLVLGAVGEGGALAITEEVAAEGVKLKVRLKQRGWTPDAVKNAVACLGGSAGTTVEGGETDAWLVVPRA